MKLLLNDQPLYMPSGSVRSIIALAIVGSFIAGLVPIEVATLVLGFYFAARQSEAQDDAQAEAVEAARNSHNADIHELNS